MSKIKGQSLRAVLITGASTGIGEACALELVRRGFRVFAGVRSASDGQRLEQAASTVLSPGTVTPLSPGTITILSLGGKEVGTATPLSLGGGHHGVVGVGGEGAAAHGSPLRPLLIDVTQPETIAAAAQTVTAAVGDTGLAGLVNNAGIAVTGPVEFVPLDFLRRQLEVNVIGQVAVIQALMRLLRRARGRIVNISSISGILAAPFFGPYAASKHALEAISDSLRVELRHWGIAVSVVEPGNVKTPIWAKARATADEIVQQMPPEAEKLYGRDIEALRRAAVRMAETGMPVEKVVRAVVHALTARRPKTRYPVGAQPRLASLFWHLLNDRMHDWILCRELRLP